MPSTSPSAPTSTTTVSRLKLPIPAMAYRAFSSATQSISVFTLNCRKPSLLTFVVVRVETRELTAFSYGIYAKNVAVTAHFDAVMTAAASCGAETHFGCVESVVSLGYVDARMGT